MIVVTSRGGDYSGAMKPFDFLEPSLRSIFGFVGITDIEFFNAQPMDISVEIRRNAQRETMREVRAYAEACGWRVGGRPEELTAAAG